MIKSHGTADNFNTELSERLHIDMAKDAYEHTNKKGYISQMRQWLQRHEAVRKFTAYLLWATKDRDNDDDDSSNGGPAGSESLNATSLQHHTAINPPFVMKLDTLKSKLDADQFGEALEKFLLRSGSLQVRPPRTLRHAINCAHYPVFKQLTIDIPSPPQVTSEPFIRDTVHAKEGKPGGTVLVKEGLPIDDDVHIKWWDIKG